ncbi:hypothetical protein [Streptomyces sp. NBC_01445]|uniref:hypothetical protein n=1 Tax=Streptomyces sp. NBC_01445 TaxID=2903869 RepID=UPI002DDB80C5|nr:hypothetical protein [Streptomyces sp. NBC_01445]WSE06017.1 hypothetical protein OG574_23305 [Streptomyces sp. NBC_01445]
MKPTARGTLAVLAGCLAAAGAGAAPAVAGEQVPVAVPLTGVENALHVKAPELSTGVPIPLPGGPDAPRFVAGRMLPEPLLPAVPLSSELPETRLEAPLSQVTGDHKVDHLGLTTAGSDVRTATPGASVNPPLTGPPADRFGLPDVALPEAAVVTPLLTTAPGAALDIA